MADVDLAAKRYAIAAFELARDKNGAHEWIQALDRMVEFMTRPDVSQVLQNTRAGQDVKQQLLEAGLNDLPPLPLNLARLLVRKNRTALVADIATELKQLLEEDQGVLHAKAITAVPLNNLELDGLARKLEQQTGKRVVLETAVDPSILGGIVIQVGDKLLDASSRARLEALRETLAGAR